MFLLSDVGIAPPQKSSRFVRYLELYRVLQGFKQNEMAFKC